MIFAALDLWNQMINAQPFSGPTVAACLRISEFDFLVIVKRSHLHRAGRQALEQLGPNHVVNATIRINTRLHSSMSSGEVRIRTHDMLSDSFDGWNGHSIR